MEKRTDAVTEKGRSVIVNRKKISRKEDLRVEGESVQQLLFKERFFDRNEALNVLWYFDPGNTDPYLYNPGPQEIKRVKKEEWPDDRFFWPSQMEDWANKYWTVNGVKLKESAFYISFYEADKLIQANNKKDILNKALAFEVSGINDPSKKVRASFNVYDEGKWKHNANRGGQINRNLPHVYKLDSYFFEAWTKKEVAKIANDNNDGPKNPNKYKVFKGYIEHNDKGEFLGDHPYKNLYLVGRFIDIGGNGENKYGVVILVAIPENRKPEKSIGVTELDNIKDFWKFQIEPWTTHGPEGTGGGGAMP